MFNIEEDPVEMNNVAGLEEQRGIEHELRRALLAWCERTGDDVVNRLVGSP